KSEEVFYLISFLLLLFPKMTFRQSVDPYFLFFCPLLAMTAIPFKQICQIVAALKKFSSIKKETSDPQIHLFPIVIFLVPSNYQRYYIFSSNSISLVKKLRLVLLE